MKNIVIDEEDDELFNHPIQEENFVFFENKKDLNTMMMSQPPAFWIQFVISFREYMRKNMILSDDPSTQLHMDEAFITLLKTVGYKRVEAVSQLVDDVMWYQVYLTSESSSDAGKDEKSQQIAQNLFANVQDKELRLKLFSVYTRFVGALVQLFQRWRMARKGRMRQLKEWIPPPHWMYPDGQTKPGPFEIFLKNHWGNKFHKVVCLPKSKILWWKSVAVCNGNKVPKANVEKSEVESNECNGEASNGAHEMEPEIHVETESSENESEDNSADHPFDFEYDILREHRLREYNRRLFLQWYFARALGDDYFPFMSNRFNRPAWQEEETWRTGRASSAGSSRQTNSASRPQSSHTAGLYQKCANCNILEPSLGAYKRCKRCLDEKFPVPKVYCGRHCQAIDWHRNHKNEHKNFKKQKV